MEISEVTPDLYKTIINKPSHAFNSAEFSNLNAPKCEKVHYLLFKDAKYRMGIVLGVRNNILSSPFSASFGGFETFSREIKIHQIDAIIEVLIEWSKQNKYDGINIISPPYFYNPNFFVKITNSLFRANFQIKNSEINYHFETNSFNSESVYLTNIWPNARNKVRQALTYPLIFNKIDNSKGLEAYDIISQNRSERGFPLRLSYDQLKETEPIIPIDYFLVSDNNQSIAAAIVFHLSKEVVRVVYWGDLPKFSEYKTMNFLSYKIFQHYKELGIPYIDIGHSTVDSIPNHGLCEFKESIGCSLGILNNYYKKI
jgi:hypothetical protein